MPEILLVHIERALVEDIEQAPQNDRALRASVTETEPALARLAAAPGEIASMVLGAGIEDPVALVQRSHRVDPDLPIVLATEPGDEHDLDLALRLARSAGADVRYAVADDRAALCDEALAAAKRRGIRRGGARTIAPDSDHEMVGRPSVAGDFGLLLDYAPLGLITVDAQGGIYGRSPHARLLLERPEHEPLGYPLPLVFPGSERARLRAVLARAAQGTSPVSITLARGQTDGGHQYLELTAAAHEVASEAGAIVLLQDVTAREAAREERDRKEEALRESERRFRAIFDQAAAGIALVSPERRFTEVNEGFCRLVGYSRDELLAMDDPTATLSHPDDVEAHRAYADALALDGSGPHQLEKRYIRKDGHEVWVRLGLSALRDDQGRLQQFIGVVENVDERKRTEAALQASEERLRLILESLTNYAVFTTDLEGRITDWNRGAERLLGFAESEIIGRPVDVIFPPEAREAGVPQRERDQALAQGQSFDDRWQMRRDGTYFWASGLTQSLRRNGKPHGLVKVLRDRTESKRSHDQLEARARQQAAIASFGQRALSDLPLNRLADEVVQLTAETLDVPLGALLQLIPERHELRLDAAVGWPRERIGVAHVGAGRASHAGYTLMSGQPIVLEDLASETRFAASPLLREADVMSGISVAVAGSGGHPWGVLEAYSRQPRRFSDDDISFMQAMANTLAAAIRRYRTEQQLRELNETLEQRVAERTAETEQRAAQLRALTSELTQTEQRERRRLAQVLHDNLQQMLVAGKLQLGTAVKSVSDEHAGAALNRVGDLLDQAIRESRSLTVELSPPVLYDAGLVAALEWLGRWMEEHHGLALDVEASDDADPAGEDLRVLLFQGARELLFNVVKHAGVDRARVELRRDARQRIEVRICDEGAGFDPDAAAQAETRNEGFGLFSIRERLARLQGEMRVESAPGAGTCVTLAVAEHADAAAAEESADPSGMPAAGEPEPARTAECQDGAIRVVLADDHDVVREGLVGVLNAQSDIAVIGEAEDGRAAVELVRRDRPDVVVLDVTMPRVNGVEAARIITEEFPDVRVIGLSVHESGDMANAMRKAGATAYLNKAGPSNRLLEAVRGVPEHAAQRARP